MGKKAEKAGKLSGLAGNPNNPRFMREANAEHLKNSISKLGDLSCIVFNERTGQLVGGHQRKNVILQLIGSDPDITITHEYPVPNEVRTTKEGHILIWTERYKVRFVDFSEADEHLAVIVANDKRNQGEYDLWLLPTVVDLANGSNLSVDFGLMDFVEGFDFLGGADNQPPQVEGKQVEFETSGADKMLSFKLSAGDYQRVKDRIKEIKNARDLDTDEEAFMFVLFA